MAHVGSGAASQMQGEAESRITSLYVSIPFAQSEKEPE